MRKNKCSQRTNYWLYAAIFVVGVAGVYYGLDRISDGGFFLYRRVTQTLASAGFMVFAVLLTVKDLKKNRQNL